jgi:hypothetical protein
MQWARWLILVVFTAVAILVGQTDLFEWSLSTSLEAGRGVSAIAFSSNGAHAVVATSDGAIATFDPGSGSRALRTVASHRSRIISLRFMGDGAIASAGEDGTVLLSSLAGSVTRSFRVGAKLVAASVSTDGTMIAAATSDKRVSIWDISSGREIGTLKYESKKPFFALGFAAKDTTLLGVSQSGDIREWDVKTGAVLRATKEADQTVQSAFVAEDGAFLVLGTEFADFQKGPFGGIGPGRSARPGDVYRENRIRIYDLSRFSVAKTLTGIDGAVTAVALSPDGRFIGFVRNPEKMSFLAVYDTARGVEAASAQLREPGSAVAFSRRGDWLGAATQRGDLIAWAVKGIGGRLTADDLRGVAFVITSAGREPVLNAGSPLPVAVLDFAANGLERPTGRAVAEMVRTRIGEGRNVTLVERELVDKIIKEQNLQISDRVDPPTAVKLGKMLGAQKLVLGSVSRLDSRLTLNVHVVDVRSGVVDGTREITCDPCKISMLQEAVTRLTPVLVK